MQNQHKIDKTHILQAKRLGIITFKEAVVYLPINSHVCKAEGFETQSRIQVSYDNNKIIAILNIVQSELLQDNEIGLSERAWELLNIQENALVNINHPPALHSMSYVRKKIYGGVLEQNEFDAIVNDLVSGNLSDVQISSFLTSCANGGLGLDEVVNFTKSMINAGTKLNWNKDIVVDKHCIGGLPGNRTTIIVVPIIAACGLTIPKTSSRSITSASGTADTMETLAPVELSFQKIQQIVERENGCIVWGDAAKLSPADDILIRVEHVLNLDSVSQMMVSILSKKIAAGSTHVLIDMPIGPTAKIREYEKAKQIADMMIYIGKSLNIHIETLFSDGTKPVGYGIGPSLEACDILNVLQNKSNAPQDLVERSLTLAGKILEFSPSIKQGDGLRLATETLKSGKAWQKFQAICDAQGGMREPPIAKYTYTYSVGKNVTIEAINNRYLALLAKLAGAPNSKSAGVYLHNNVGAKLMKHQPILTIHAESSSELDYAVNFLENNNIVDLKPC